MTSQDKFIALTRKGEDTRIEYKTCTEEISESLYESVCSLLNHSGGQILVGVQNDGTIIGVNPEKVEQLRTDIVNCINNPELFLPCPYILRIRCWPECSMNCIGLRTWVPAPATFCAMHLSTIPITR